MHHGDCCAFELKKINENKFMCGYHNQIIKIWNVSNKSEPKLECTTHVTDKTFLIQMKVSLELNLIFSCSADRIYIWKLNDLVYGHFIRLIFAHS
jgi:hypothetical protein